jgi:hypothetical protein
MSRAISFESMGIGLRSPRVLRRKSDHSPTPAFTATGQV